MASRHRTVFISYAHQDRRVAEVVAAALRKRGHTVLIDVQLLQAADRWDKELQAAIDRADIVVLVVSRAAVGSQEVDAEIGYALSRHLPVVPFVLGAVRPTEVNYRLAGFQHAVYDPQDELASLGRVVHGVEKGGTRTTRQRRSHGRAVLVVALVVSLVATVVWTVVAGRIPPWSAVPTCDGLEVSITGSGRSRAGSVVELEVRNASSGTVHLPDFEHVSLMADSGAVYPGELRSGDNIWFGGFALPAGSSRTIGIAVQVPADGRDEVGRIVVTGVRPSGLPILRCRAESAPAEVSL